MDTKEQYLEDLGSLDIKKVDAVYRNEHIGLQCNDGKVKKIILKEDEQDESQG